MYKLVVVGGKLRGQEFILKPGDNILGRESSCDIPFPVDGVSKRHVHISITGDVVFIEDQGSANGTFVNGKLIKRVTVQPGDRIGLPNAILQLVYVKEKVVVVKKKVNLHSEKEETAADILQGTKAPDNIAGKIIWLFKYKFMPIELESPTATIIYGGKVILQSWTKNPFAVLIEDAQMAENQKRYFEELWKIAKR